MSPSLLVGSIALILVVTSLGAWGALVAIGKVLRTPGLTRRRAMWVTLMWCVMSAAVGALMLPPAPVAIRATAAISFLVLLTLLMKRAAKCGWKRAVAVTAVFILAAFVWALVVKAAANATLIEAYQLASSAMEPAMSPGDLFIAERTTSPQRWDIVVFRPRHDPKARFVFRVVGLPGETVEIIDDQVNINGSPATRPVEISGLRYDGSLLLHGFCYGGTGHPVTLGRDEFYVLGDNTEHALDSRFWASDPFDTIPPGVLLRRDILGVVRAIYSPFAHARWFK